MTAFTYGYDHFENASLTIPVFDIFSQNGVSSLLCAGAQSWFSNSCLDHFPPLTTSHSWRNRSGTRATAKPAIPKPTCWTQPGKT